MRMTSDEAVKISAFLRLGFVSQCLVERQVLPKGSESVLYVCVVQKRWNMAHCAQESLHWSWYDMLCSV